MVGGATHLLDSTSLDAGTSASLYSECAIALPGDSAGCILTRMRTNSRKLARLFGLCAVLVVLAAHSARPKLGDVIDSVLRNGRNGQLPPHLSLVLGIGSGEAPLEVKQAVLRNGSEVRVFKVCVANHENIVILRVNELQGNTKAYLVSTSGKLRKAVSFRAGEQPQQTPAAEADAASAEEIKFWTGLRQHATLGP